jgi:hypothetical protein
VLPAGSLASELRIVQGIDLRSIPRIDGVTAEFSVSSEQAGLQRKYVGHDCEIPDLAIMRKLGIQRLKSRTDGG